MDSDATRETYTTIESTMHGDAKAIGTDADVAVVVPHSS